MPSELDPAYGNYLPPSQWDETPTEDMKRIEAEMQDRPNTQRGRLAAGAGRSLEGYNARVGAQGPVGGGVMVAADPVTGRPVMVAGQAQAWPLSYQYSKPTVRGAPASQQIGVGGQPFDADTYFGVSAQQAPGQGRTYGANVSQGGDDGGWSAYAGYNPTNRSANIGGSYQTNFASGGRALVGHTTAAGEPISLEEHKGQIRHRQSSGNSRMAADYGYIDTSKPDHDGMKTDVFVGPYHDSKKVFVVNQQHPHTGKFNEHKVLLGYKDRAHALRDYAHSFSDGLGHKRIQSVVEMGTHELKDWLKKDHTAPLRKASGGPVGKTTKNMNVDAFVGPHKDSTRAFIIEQRHPHTKKNYEHKVLLGYKDGAHAVHDYIHSFRDDRGHERIASVVEIGTHELLDWLKKNHVQH